LTAALRLAEKDAALALDAADGRDLELLQAVREDFRRAHARADGDEDMAAVRRAYLS
jgi:3-hydroxyisobutyrate dehydrogenase-like beta-hydroxyacid dehydrogenase